MLQIQHRRALDIKARKSGLCSEKDNMIDYTCFCKDDSGGRTDDCLGGSVKLRE